MFRKFLPLAIAAAFFTPALAYAAPDTVWFSTRNDSGGNIELLEQECPVELRPAHIYGVANLHLIRATGNDGSGDSYGCGNFVKDGEGKFQTLRVYWRSYTGATVTRVYPAAIFDMTPEIAAHYRKASN